MCTNTHKGINILKIPLPFNKKNINECSNKILSNDNIIRFKLITINYEDTSENVILPIKDEMYSNNFILEEQSKEKHYITRNYILLLGKEIYLYDLIELNLLYQCQPVTTLHQSSSHILYTSLVSYNSYLIIGSSVGHLILCQVKNNKIEIIKIIIYINTSIIDIDVNNTGIIAVAYDDGQIYTYKVDNNSLIQLSGFSNESDNAIITQLKIGEYILASYSSGQIRLFSYNDIEITLQCEIDLGYSEIKGIDYWNSQNMFTVIVHDIVYIWKIINKEIKTKSFIIPKLEITSSDQNKYAINENSSDNLKIKTAENNEPNTTTNKEVNQYKNIELTNNNDIDSLTIKLKWNFQMENKYLTGVKFLKHLNCEIYNTDDLHNFKYIAVVAYDYPEIDIYSISYKIT
jgi:hypothetical protein